METSIRRHGVALADGHFGLCLHFEQDKFLRVKVTGDRQSEDWLPFPAICPFALESAMSTARYPGSAVTRGNRILAHTRWGTRYGDI